MRTSEECEELARDGGASQLTECFEMTKSGKEIRVNLRRPVPSCCLAVSDQSMLS